MRWDKFSTFTAQHLEMGSCLNMYVIPYFLQNNGSSGQYTLRTWVEDRISYIAMRPFDSLNLEASDGSGLGQTETYAVWFHIESEEKPYSRARFTESDGPGTTVQQLMDGLINWHSEYWALQADRPIVFDSVVRHVTSGTLTGRFPRHSLDIYPVPESFLATIA